jgi:hypothetical protein
MENKINRNKEIFEYFFYTEIGISQDEIKIKITIDYFKSMVDNILLDITYESECDPDIESIVVKLNFINEKLSSFFSKYTMDENLKMISHNEKIGSMFTPRIGYTIDDEMITVTVHHIIDVNL